MSPKKPKQPKPDLDAVFVAMRAILEPHRGSFKVTSRRGFYSLDDNSVRGWSIGIAAVVAKARAVSFYLCAARYAPKVFASASSKLMAHRMKAEFFNFTEIDEVLFAELGRCVKKALANWDPVAVVAK